MRPASAGHAGFTLVEVMVALLIVALALSAASVSSGQLQRRSLQARQTQLGQWCADNQLVALKLQKTFPPVGESSFECQQLGQSLQGQMNVKATPNPNFRRVEMRLLNAEQHPVYTVASILGNQP